jgi:alpha/beta superfamily hydrolase
MEFRCYKSVNIPVGKVILHGNLVLPIDTKGIVIFSHGSGSSRFSIRNQQVAKFLQQHNIGTLLFDLLTEEEDQHYYNRFDIDLLAKRLAGATDWLQKTTASNNYRLGYFGASTGAASALKAAASGRPDLAMDVLHNVEAPTLLIVGSLDTEVLQLNREAYTQLLCKKKLVIVDGATHLFEEAGKMEIVSKLAGDWFEKHLHIDNNVIGNHFAEGRDRPK